MPSCLRSCVVSWLFPMLHTYLSGMCVCVSSPADHPRYLILFRTYVSRRAAGGGRAVLEGLGIDTREINTLIGDNPNDMESAVQAGLIKWSGGNTPTWKILCEAMDFAEVPVQDIKGLKDALKNPPSDQTEGM